MTNKGFRQIDTELLQALAAGGLPGGAYQVLLVVIDLTLGYQREEAEISLAAFQERTRLSESTVRRGVESLVACGLLSVVTPPTNRRGAIYRLNEGWRPLEVSEMNTLEVSEVNTPSVIIDTPRGVTPLPDDVHIIDSKDNLIDIPVGDAIKHPAPLVTLIFNQMRSHLGYPGKLDKDPIPSYGKEGQAIKRMLARGFTLDKIMACWKGKVSERGGDFVSMTWVNEDIGKKAGHGSKRTTYKQRRSSLRSCQLPERGLYHEPGESEEAYRARMALKGITIE